MASNAGARATFSYELSVLSLAYSFTGPSGGIVNPWGSSPSYTNGSIRNVNRPNEQAALLNYSYDFRKLSVPGLSATAIYLLRLERERPDHEPATAQPVGVGSGGRLSLAGRQLQGFMVPLAAQSTAERGRYERDHAMARDRLLGDPVDLTGADVKPKRRSVFVSAALCG